MTYFATEYGSIEPTTNFNRASDAASREADERGSASAIYENGRLCMIVYPATRVAFAG